MQSRGQAFLVNARETLEGDETHLLAQAKSEKEAVSNAALWMLLLLRLTSATTDRRAELRNSTLLIAHLLQSIANIFRRYSNPAKNI